MPETGSGLGGGQQTVQQSELHPIFLNLSRKYDMEPAKAVGAIVEGKFVMTSNLFYFEIGKPGEYEGNIGYNSEHDFPGEKKPAEMLYANIYFPARAMNDSLKNVFIGWPNAYSKRNQMKIEVYGPGIKTMDDRIDAVSRAMELVSV